jgi:hypothetical protein
MKLKILLLFAGVCFSILLTAFLFRPVCVPLSDEDVAGMNVPIAERTDRDFYLRIFQEKDGRWQQCKTWISRAFFF